jgi:SPP1 gp7 family putative phage head morphogenesis protein
MARHVASLAEALANRRALTKAHARTKDPRKLSPSERRAVTPKAPRGPLLAYLRGIAAALAEVRDVLRDILPGIVAEATSKVPKGAVPRTDAPRGPSTNVHRQGSAKFGPLEFAISDKLSKKKLGVMLTGVGEHVEAHNREEMTRVLRINLRDPGHGLAPWIDHFVDRNVNLIQSVAYEQLGQMEDLVADATTGQVRVESLADDIMERFEVTESRANLIARDQTLKANANLTQLRQQQVGVTRYVWTCSGDERVRGRPGGKWADSDSDHWSLDGTVQEWTNPPITNPKTGARNHPGEDYQCRCTATPVVDDILGPPIDDEAASPSEDDGEVGDWGDVGPRSPWEVLDARSIGQRRRKRR